MDKKNNDGTYQALAIVLSVLVIVFTYFFTIPKYRTNLDVLAQSKVDVEAANSKLQSLEATKQDLDSLGILADQMLIALPGDKDAPNVIAELEAIASKYKTYIPAIQITDGSEAATATGTTAASNGKTTIAFSVNGGFSDINGFIKTLENDVKLLNIKSLTYSADTKDTNNMTLSVQLEAYKRSASSVASSAN